MKHLTSLFFVIALLFTACNKNDEPPKEINLPIERNYLPAVVEFQKDDHELVEKFKEFTDKQYVVNNLSELPDDPIGFNNAFRGINFNQYTLLIAYDATIWDVDTYFNRFYFDTTERRYIWVRNTGISEIPDSDNGERYFTRFAILVSKLPADADVQFYSTLSALNWDWEE